MECSYKFRIYPNKAQESLIQQTFGCSRFVYNHYLALRKAAYEERQETIGEYACSKNLTQLKKSPDTDWLNTVDDSALRTALTDLERAYQNFFRNVKKGEKPGYPRFKSKRDHRKSYRSKCVRTNIKVLDKAVQLPKLGNVRCKVSKEVKGRILSATVSQSPSGKYFVALNCTDVKFDPSPKTDDAVGLDLGIKTFAAASDGVKYPNHKYLSKSRKKLARLQRRLSRKTKGSANWNKQRIKVARCHERIANQRSDTMHKLSTDLIRRYDIICIEDLGIKEMMHDCRFAEYIGDASWYEFRRQLSYKADWYGKKVITVDRDFPSTTMCSDCRDLYPSASDLSVRRWTCPHCGTHHDRDVNAARNILNEGLRLLA